ncbi:MAG: hypothetical protein QM723_24990 [Myxococcaceae bacterium]
MANDFFPYHPLKLRVALTVGALCALTLGAWALATAVHSGVGIEYARAGICLGLLGSMLYVHLKLRPRPGWGVSVEATRLKVSRPIEGEIEIPWSAVTQVKRNGAEKETLIVFVGEEKRVLVSRHLFASKGEYEKVASAIEEKMVAPTVPQASA